MTEWRYDSVSEWRGDAGWRCDSVMEWRCDGSDGVTVWQCDVMTGDGSKETHCCTHRRTQPRPYTAILAACYGDFATAAHDDWWFYAFLTVNLTLAFGSFGTAQCVRRRLLNSNVFSCRRITATTGCRPVTTPGTAQRPPVRTCASETRNSETFLLVRCLAVISQVVTQLAARSVRWPHLNSARAPDAASRNK